MVIGFSKSEVANDLEEWFWCSVRVRSLTEDGSRENVRRGIKGCKCRYIFLGITV